MVKRNSCKTENIHLKVNYEEIEEIMSNDSNFKIENNLGEIKKDILVDREKYYRIYGRVISDENILYKGILVKLINYNNKGAYLYREEVDKTITDLYGEFNFIVRANNDIDKYVVEISN